MWALALAVLALGAVSTLAVFAPSLRPALPIAGSLAIFPIVLFAFSLARFDTLTVGIVLGGLALYLAYLGYTDFGERNYDAGEQLRYVEYVLANHARPPATYCLVCHHPPLYYAVAAVVYRFFEATGLGAPISGLQLLGLACHLIFLGYALGTARRLLSTARDLHLAAALIVFWPSGIENAVRVHNDSLASTLMCAATFYLVRWSQQERPRDLYLAAIVAGLALLTKSSAYAVVAALGVVFVLRFLGSRQRLRLAAVGLVAGLFLTSAAIYTVRTKDIPGSGVCHAILGTACDVRQEQLVDNRFQNYLVLDLGTFVREPYAFAEKDGSGRQYFWNHLLKSSLFGTHNRTPDAETSYEVNRVIAYAMNGLLLGMVAYAVLGAAIFARRRALRRFGVALVCLAACVAFMAGFRALIPAPHHSDFRHIFSSVALVGALYAATVGRARMSSPWLERVGRALAIVFVGLSIVYFVPKQDWAIGLARHVVQRDIGRYGKVVPAGTDWDAEGNLIILPEHIVEFAITGAPTVGALDLSLDGNDRYEVDIVGDQTRTLTLGPTRGTLGLARYAPKVVPPVTRVRTIRLRPVWGDYAYSLGHILLRPE